jgi:hypothetical protein
MQRQNGRAAAADAGSIRFSRRREKIALPTEIFTPQWVSAGQYSRSLSNNRVSIDDFIRMIALQLIYASLLASSYI